MPEVVLPNPTLEVDASGWSPRGTGCTIERVSKEDAPEGTHVLKVNTSGSGGIGGVRSDSSAAEPEDVNFYKLSVWVPSGRTLHVGISERNSSDSQVAFHEDVLEVEGESKWVEIEPGEGFNKGAKARLFMEMDGVTASAFYVDAPAEEEAEPEPESDIEYVAEKIGGGTSTTRTVERPAGAQEDDVIVVLLSTTTGSPGELAIEGFEKVKEATSSGLRTAWFVRRIGVIGSEPSTYTASWGGASVWNFYTAAMWRGVRTEGDPYHSSYSLAAASGTSASAPSVTAPAGSMIVWGNGNKNGATIATPEDFTVRSDKPSEGKLAEAPAAGGETGAIAATLSGSVVHATGMLVLMPPEEPGPEVSFYEDFEDGDSDFDETQLEGAGAKVEVSTSSPIDGTRSAIFTLTEGDERAELALWGTELTEGYDVYYGLDYLLDASFPTDIADWQVLGQFRQDGESGSGVVAWGPNDDGTGDWIVETGPASGVETQEIWHGPAMDAAKHRIVIRVRVSPDPEVGFVEVWWDGEKQTLTNEEERFYCKTLPDDSDHIYPKAGYYRNPAIEDTGILRIDRVALSNEPDALVFPEDEPEADTGIKVYDGEAWQPATRKVLTGAGWVEA